MQTFLPYPSFAESAEVLDSPRLGKQRVETLQIARALLVPTYGWQRHPAVGMWRGYLPALTAYGLAMTDAWTRRGFADSVREQLVEFAPEVDGRTQEELADAGLLPPWLGNEAVHESHRSKLIAKDPAFYGSAFPGTQEGLEYHWPHPLPVESAPVGDRMWILRVDDVDTWREAGLVGIPATAPSGKITRAWRAQLDDFDEHLGIGTAVGVLGRDLALLHLAEITGPAAAVTIDEAEFVARSARFEGNLDRASLAVPALLQNPRRIFPVHLAPAVVREPAAARLAP